MTMQRLTEIIGKAPSEMTPDEHISFLTFERNRVRSALQAFRTGFDPRPKKGKAKSAKPKPKKEPIHPVLLAAQKAGLSVEQIKLVLAKMKEEADAQ